MQLVSIHARQFHSGRPDRRALAGLHAGLFQSTPANFTAGDGIRTVNAILCCAFQSTPANFTAGDDDEWGQLARVIIVSIHARQFHSGRRISAGITDLAAMFQSTPANFTAGDQAPRGAEPARQLVSIHARQFHSGRPETGGLMRFSTCVSIHARQFHSGRRLRYSNATAATNGFNPRPPISQRATRPAPQCGAAPRRFQSTPANFTAGDSSLAPRGTPWSSFNPRPPISQRATICRCLM